MLNATRDTLNKKMGQLDALISVMAAGALDELGTADRSNFTWLMSDLMGEIRSTINGEAEARNG